MLRGLALLRGSAYYQPIVTVKTRVPCRVFLRHPWLHRGPMILLLHTETTAQDESERIVTHTQPRGLHRLGQGGRPCPDAQAHRPRAPRGCADGSEGAVGEGEEGAMSLSIEHLIRHEAGKLLREGT